MERLHGEQAKRQPDDPEKDRREHVSKKMRAEGDPAKSHEKDQKRRAENREPPPTRTFDKRQNKKQELPVKKRRSNRVAAGKTITRPIHKWTVDKWSLPVNQNFHPFVQ